MILTDVANALYAQMMHVINCSEVFTKSSAFQESILIRSDMSPGTVETLLFWGDILLQLNKRKNPYLVIQTWRIVKWFRYPYDAVGCYLCISLPSMTAIDSNERQRLSTELTSGIYKRCTTLFHYCPNRKNKIYEPRHDKTNKVSVRPAKTQISLGIRPV